MGEIAAVIKKHPELIALAVIAVVVIAWLQSRGSSQSGTSGDLQFTGGGVTSVPVDPNAAAIQQTQINANSANLSTLSQLFLGLNEAAYARDVQEGQTNASLSASLAETEASRAVGLAQVEGAVDIAGINANRDINVNRTTTDAQVAQAQINQVVATNVAQANLQAHLSDTAAIEDTNATQRDIARVNARGSVWNNVVNVAGDVVKILSLGFL